MKLPIFLVEDNATVRASLAAVLQDVADVECVGFAEGEAEAVACLEDRDEWKLAIVDIFLREGSGLGVLQAVSTRADDQYVVVLSNYATPTLRERCRELGADAVFDKSGDIDALLDFCRECALSARATA